MPKRYVQKGNKSRRAGAKKKAYRKKKAGKKARGRVHRLRAFPDKLKVRLRYTSAPYYLNMDNTTKVQLTTHFTGNNCYDPETSIGGGQPKYFDQLRLIYKYHTVTSSRIKVTCIAPTNSNTNTNPYYATVIPTSQILYPAFSGFDWQSYPEYAHAKTRLIQDIAGVPLNQKVIKHFMRTSKIQGIPKVTAKDTAHKVDNDNGNFVQGGQSWYWAVVLANHLLSSNCQTTIQVMIEYFVTFTDIRQVSDELISGVDHDLYPSQTGTAKYSLSFDGTGTDTNAYSSFTGGANP